MRSRCYAFEEAIWEHARTGTELSADAMDHIHNCDRCALAVREARRVLGAILDTDCVPPTPDCRQAVMARISPAERRPRLAWSYAFAGVALAAVAVGGVVTMRPDPTIPTKQRVARDAGNAGRASRVGSVASVREAAGRAAEAGDAVAETPSPGRVHPERILSSVEGRREGWGEGAQVPAKKQTPRPKPGLIAAVPESVPVPEPKREEPTVMAIAPHVSDFAAMEKEEPAEVRASALEKDSSPQPDMVLEAPHAPAPAPPIAMDMARNAGMGLLAKKAGSAAEPAPEDVKNRPIALAVVTWPTSIDPTNYSYAYTERDSQTGTVTRCLVSRSGNSIEIELIAEPETPEPPVKGSVDYESDPSA